MFAQEVMEDYHIELATGHSKGGNFAQLATVLSDGKIDECVSFDGQGFSDEFIELHRQEIDNNKFRITSISSDKDFVNVLLNCIAERNIYIDTDTSSCWEAHSTRELKKPHLFKKDGNYREDIMCQRSKVASFIHNASIILYKMRAKNAADFLGKLFSRVFAKRPIEEKFDMLNKFYMARNLDNKPMVKIDGKYIKEPNDFEILENALILSEIKQSIELIGKSTENINYVRENSEYLKSAYKELILGASECINRMKEINEEGKFGVDIEGMEAELEEAIKFTENKIIEYEKSGKMSLMRDDMAMYKDEQYEKYQNCESLREAAHMAYMQYSEQNNQNNQLNNQLGRNDIFQGDR